MFRLNNVSKDRRHPGHDIRRGGEGRGPLQFGGDHRTCNPRDPFCGREDPRRERYRRESLARDDGLFEPRRSIFQGGLNPAGPMGGLAGGGLMGGLGSHGLFGGSPLFAGPGYADDLADLNARGPPMGIPISELTAGMGIGGGLRGLQNAPAHGFGRLQPQHYDHDGPMMMQQQQYANIALPRSPLIDPRIQYFDERALGGYQRENLLNSPMALGHNPRENILLRGRGIPMNAALSPLHSKAASIRSGRSGRGFEVPMMSGGVGFGNYRSPYVEDYESELDELDRAMREQEWFGQDFSIVG